MMEQVNRGDMGMLREMHTVLSGMKAVYSWQVCNGTENARQTCGGAGYSLFAGIAHGLQDYNSVVTLEGDNMVMMQQCARGLLKSMRKLQKGRKVEGLSSYLNNAMTLNQKECEAKSAKDFDNLDLLEEALQVKATHMITQTALKLVGSSKDPSVVWNEL